MLTNLMGSRALLRASIVLVALLIWDERCYSHGFSLQSTDFTGVKSYSLTFTTKKNRSGIEASFEDVGIWKIRVAENSGFWDIETEEGKKQLSEYLDEKARGQLQELAKQRELTPEQLAKLNVAARIQVARDCRTVQELISSSVKAIRDNPFFGVQQMRNDELGLMRNCAQLSDLFEDGIVRNDSLFKKVLNHLK